MLGLAGVAVAAFVVVSQWGGRDRAEFGGLMDGPKPEQGRLAPEPEASSGDDAGSIPPPPADSSAPAGPEPVVTPPEVVPPSSDLVTSTVRSVRNVTAPGMTPAQVPSGELEREAMPKRPPAPPRWKVFSPVTVREADLLGAGGRSIRLAGIVPPAAGRQCRRPATEGAAVEMPCARMAVVALRNRIRSFGVECQVAANDAADPAVAPCRIGKTDLSLWMIEQGWAEAAPRAPEGYGAAEKEARCARRGIWQAGDTPADCLQN
jgi:endonuclease YncB( thermonuclease family)